MDSLIDKSRRKHAACVNDHEFSPETCHLCRLFRDSPFHRHMMEFGYPPVGWESQNHNPVPHHSTVESKKKICIHLGKAVRGPAAPDNLRDWRQCDKGHGVVCACGVCKTCPDKETEEEGMLKCSDVTKDTSVEEMVELLEFGDPGPWPSGWAGWANVQQAHLKLLEKFLSNIPAYPGGFSGRGIVSCVSAKPGFSSGKNLEHGYFPGAWVMVKELRRLGCKLPITFTHLGPVEFDSNLKRLVEPLGVQVIDLREWERSTGAWRILCGFESSIASVIACPYEEALWLDADNVPLQDPTFLFDDPKYNSTGAIFWPDLPPHDRKEWVDTAAWASMGMEYRNEVDFESGQILVNKNKCWRETMLTKWINEHSDRYYSVVFGDKTTFHLGWAKFGSPYALPRSAGWNGAAILQYDMSGRLLFEHCVQNKPTLSGYRIKSALSNWGECESHIKELRGLWNGRLWDGDPTGAAKEIEKQLIGKLFMYKRIGLGQRELRFLEDNRIGKGADRCEFSWSVSEDDGKFILSVSDIDGKPTMLLRQAPGGMWTGRWLDHEKAETILEPL